ncbi:UDP-2,3-diacylglucosamine diphosphatase [Pseudotabrizicola sp.]|uniref:UDP-2,3-diacylglucosamine diphosphatase n=1 Tax=Pseudotabrizicola sp. TaxID=2939647 RepID=UPI00271835A0|nr:UDP-2,3-diacylglucosamine diphosphatase [Pseudotabrizicola sp.]MDO8884468.1 UDP-2,3-diacylglucosamine diphosphatase [Pseudotabrizicola sp.]MDP2081349.1 UDP-2,3-diacylglucosamine diphosphatase [Pseudotabrizicola sp.]
MGSSIQHHRGLFLSDLHLGALGSRADLILSFLQHNHADTYVLVGDILDLWQPLLPHWTDDAQRVMDHLRSRQQAGAVVHYLRGNHDPDPARAPKPKGLNVRPVDELVYLAGDQRKYLVLHGDIVDARVVRSHALTRLGSRIDHALRRLDRGLSVLRRGTSAEARSTIEALLAGVNSLLYRGRKHEVRVVDMARQRGLDGVICGHFHIAGLHDDHGLTYANCGDWLDSMTALAEDSDGTLRLMSWRPVAAALNAGLPSPELKGAA